MQKMEFMEFLEKISTFYGVKVEEDKSRLRMWYGNVESIPGHALESVHGRIVRKYSHFPKNLPKAMLDAWEQWSAENPDRVRAAASGVPRGVCPDGCDNGVFYIQRQVNGQWVNTVAFCRQCHGGNGTTRAELERSGAVVYPLLHPVGVANQSAARAANA